MHHLSTMQPPPLKHTLQPMAHASTKHAQAPSTPAANAAWSPIQPLPLSSRVPNLHYTSIHSRAPTADDYKGEEGLLICRPTGCWWPCSSELVAGWGALTVQGGTSLFLDQAATQIYIPDNVPCGHRPFLTGCVKLQLYMCDVTTKSWMYRQRRPIWYGIWTYLVINAIMQILYLCYDWDWSHLICCSPETFWDVSATDNKYPPVSVIAPPPPPPPPNHD